ncbi:hypothetical protein SCHPADRAFT_910736 [Schizopora paradoxa]|uniref:Zn(2)-C6 fungal-type domain-containing protein n=1 Tax=Schizopora paradoxa TaxID=27342 RepID=A0A0H2RLW1_9AGAM|nr:hypothetical protein SCHPADRAFT_910736 [Schizopora paradoxa]
MANNYQNQGGSYYEFADPHTQETLSQSGGAPRRIKPCQACKTAKKKCSMQTNGTCVRCATNQIACEPQA